MRRGRNDGRLSKEDGEEEREKKMNKVLRSTGDGADTTGGETSSTDVILEWRCSALMHRWKGWATSYRDPPSGGQPGGGTTTYRGTMDRKTSSHESGPPPLP